jgi:hypothetical protein
MIDAFNANKPFDVFTTEQLAGDLLPGATVQQRVASGFNRNTIVNAELSPFERDVLVMLDRVNTTATVLLGSSLACAQCLAERGVRFIQLYHRDWDHHFALPDFLRRQCLQTDQASAALIQDLKRRDLLKDTLVIWGGASSAGPPTARARFNRATSAATTTRAASASGWRAAASKPA